MKKVIFSILIIFLIFLTSIIKNSTKKIEAKIFNLKEDIYPIYKEITYLRDIDKIDEHEFFKRFSKRININISIYDIRGRLVSELLNDYKEHQINPYKVIWNANDISSGVYFVKMRSDNNIKTQKIMLIK